MTASVSKCRVCKQPAIIDLPRHNANFCAEHLLQLCRRQVEKAIADHDMLSPDDRILVAVSGGKDSLAVWDILLELGYQADGLYIGLGIGEYSDESGALRPALRRRAWADAAHDRPARRVRLRRARPPPRSTERVPCSACGLSKRHLFDEAARDGGYDVVVTGHNLDDEAAVLFGNALRWDVEYLARQLPVLPARDGLPEEGQAAGAPRPSARWRHGASCAASTTRSRSARWRSATSTSPTRTRSTRSSAQSPGSKAAFYLNFVERMSPLLAGLSAGGDRRAAGVLRVRLADHRRDVRLLPAAGASRRPRAGAGRAGAGQEDRAYRAAVTATAWT